MDERLIIVIGQCLDEFVKLNRNLEKIDKKLENIEYAIEYLE